jgi:hypothetical protein
VAAGSGFRIRQGTFTGQGQVLAAISQARAGSGHAKYRYVPPEQVIARAVTYIGDVLLEFSLTFTGSLTVTSAPAEASEPTEEQLTLQLAGAALHRIADGLFVSAVRADRPTIESAVGHRFTHRTTSAAGPRTRRFAGECAIEIPGGQGAEEPAITGSLGYLLDVRAVAPSDPPAGAGDRWLERHESSLASIGAVVLEPVPISAGRAARLFAG